MRRRKKVFKCFQKVVKKLSKKMSKSFLSCQEIVNKESCQKIIKSYEKENIGNSQKDHVAKLL
jgi:hypothetical protein